MGLNSPPPRDLTAERAAKQYTINDLFNLALEGKVNIVEDRFVSAAALKTARQAVLREASQAVRNRALLWRSHGGAKVGFPYGHLTIEGEYESMADELDRLASEGG